MADESYWLKLIQNNPELSEYYWREFERDRPEVLARYRAKHGPKYKQILGEKKKFKQPEPIHFTIHRFPAVIRTIEVLDAPTRSIDALFITSDEKKGSLGLFSSQPIHTGQDVTVEINRGDHKTYRGKVIWCQSTEIIRRDSNTRIIHQNSFDYRIVIKIFVDETPSKETA